MDLKQLEYIVKIADECSITRAAQQLYISQSGLNQQLLKLESELRLQLFHRSKNDLRLTEAGRIYVDYARQILQLKSDCYNILGDLADNKRGRLTVGLTPERGIAMLMGIYPWFYKEYPNITIEPYEIGVKKQLSMISKGYLDLGFVNITDQDKTADEFIHIKNERILLAVPRSHPLSCRAAAPGEPLTEIELSLFKEDRFILMFQGSTLRNLIDPLFKNAGFLPDILFETSSNRTLYSMVKSQMGCTLLPEAYAKEQGGVVYFLLPSRPQCELALVHKKGHYLTNAARFFIRLATDYWNRNPELNFPDQEERFSSQ